MKQNTIVERKRLPIKTSATDVPAEFGAPIGGYRQIRAIPTRHLIAAHPAALSGASMAGILLLLAVGSIAVTKHAQSAIINYVEPPHVVLQDAPDLANEPIVMQ